MARSTRSIILRVASCVILVVALWCRGQVSDDQLYIRYPGIAMLQVDNSLSGTGMRLSIPSPGVTSFSGRWIGCDTEPKYKAMWRHVSFSRVAPLWDSALQGIEVRSSRMFFGTKIEISATIPHALLGIFMYLLADLESRFRKRRRHAPDLCQQCGYDVRVNTIRCSECGSPIRPEALVNLEAKIRRYARRTAGIFAVGVLALHAAAGFTRVYTSHLRTALLAVDSAAFGMLKFPFNYRTPPTEPFDVVFDATFTIIVVLNCLFWAWLVGRLAHLAMRIRNASVPPATMAIRPFVV